MVARREGVGGMGEIGEGKNQVVQTANYITNKSWGCDAQQGNIVNNIVISDRW